MDILMIQTPRVGEARLLFIPLVFIRTYICGMGSPAWFAGTQHQIQGLCKPSVDLFQTDMYSDEKEGTEIDSHVK